MLQKKLVPLLKVALILLVIFFSFSWAGRGAVVLKIDPLPERVKTKTVNVAGFASTQEGKIKNIVIGQLAIGANASEVPFNVFVPLSPGENQISITVSTDTGQTIERKLIVQREVGENQNKMKPEKETHEKKTVKVKLESVSVPGSSLNQKHKSAELRDKQEEVVKLQKKVTSHEKVRGKVSLPSKKLLVGQSKKKKKRLPSKKLTRVWSEPKIRKKPVVRITKSGMRKVRVYIGNSVVRLNPAPFIQRGRVMTPIDEPDLLKKAGITLVKTKISRTTAVFIYDRKGRVVQIRIGENVVRDAGGKVIRKMDVLSFLRNGKGLVPLRFVMEALGRTVSWDHQAKKVLIF